VIPSIVVMFSAVALLCRSQEVVLLPVISRGGQCVERRLSPWFMLSTASCVMPAM
jgi:hypothetical protein